MIEGIEDIDEMHYEVPLGDRDSKEDIEEIDGIKIERHDDEILDNNDCFIYQSPKYGNIYITARLDGLTPKTVWEFKCVGEIQIEHLVQLVFYAWIWKQSRNESREFKIMNIKTGEIRKLDTTSYYIDDIVDCILDSKFSAFIRKTNEEFIKDCHDSIKDILNQPEGITIESDDEDDKIRSMKIKDLVDYCKSNGIKGYSKKTRTELIGHILDQKREESSP